MKPVQIRKFDPIVYPFKLWVVSTRDADYLRERFIDLDRKGRTEITSGDLINAEAITYYVQERDTGLIGVLVVFINKEHMSMRLIAHESTHVARKAWDHMREDVTGEEADAYLVGWIAECIEKVKLNKG